MWDKLTQTDNLLSLGIVLILLCFSAFFSGSETALTAASRARMHQLEKDGDKRATLVSKLLGMRERLLGGILLGNNFVNILASSIMAGLMLSIVGEAGIIYATIITTALILIFAEVLPKTYAISQPDKMALNVSRPINFIVIVLAPIVAVVQAIVSSTLRLFGVDTSASAYTTMDEIRGAVDLGHHEGGVAKRARDQIIGVLELDELTVEEVMIHRKNLAMVDADSEPEQIIKEVLASGHTRLPLWKGDLDNVIGVLHAKDILKALSRTDVDIKSLNMKRIAREPWFVPETTSVAQQLRAFQQKREHFALVVDEYGALMGVLTLEDIIEEIVGDIQDEHDTDIEGLSRLANGSVIARGDIPVRDLNRAMDWSMPDEEAVTLAGLVIHEAQTIPDVGQTFSFYGYRFEILERVRNQIVKLKVTHSFEPDQT
ncbi:MAG: HlyC/CorC family transporter [Maricaulaceae bacterium]